MEQKRNHDALLVTLADRNFIDQAKQLFSSVYWNAGWKGDYMLLSHEIPEKDLKWFRDKGILVKKCKSLSKKNLDKGGNSYPPVVLDKFYLFTPEFKKWKNIVYLDADIIVRFSLDELAKVRGFSSTTAFRDGQKIRNFFILKKRTKSLLREYNLNRNSFNSGVMAFSTNIIEKETFDKLIMFLKKYSEISTGDDSILNLLFYNKWKKLSMFYDLSPSYLINYLKIKPGRIKGIILHFSSDKGYLRPWDKNSPFYKEWGTNLEKSELINLRINQQAKSMNQMHRIKERFYIRSKQFFSISYKPMKNIFIKISKTHDKTLGIAGQSIKKLSPKLYHKLKGKNGTKKKS
jgi:lipopolysaccharide biosynthesis glycosyltransferase